MHKNADMRGQVDAARRRFNERDGKAERPSARDAGQT